MLINNIYKERNNNILSDMRARHWRVIWKFFSLSHSDLSIRNDISHWVGVEVSASLVLSRGFEGRMFPCLFPFLVATCIPWFPPSSKCHCNLCFCHHIAFFSDSPATLLKDTVIMLGLPGNPGLSPMTRSLITPTKSLLPYKVSFAGPWD